MHVSVKVSEKSQRLLAEGKVSRNQNPHSYTVIGDTGRYQVAITDAEEVAGWCSCESTQWVCSHILAASAYEIANPPVVVAKDSDPFEGLA